MSSRRGRRAGVAAAAVAASALSVLAAPPASADHRSDYTTNCPSPESLVSGTTWHSHRLAAGVTLKEGQRRDNRGYVDMHVLDVDVTNRHLSFAPLAHQMAQRTPLSVLAAGRSNLVAATNTGYFDFAQGTPLGPLVDRGRPWVTSSKQATVVGFNRAGTMQAGHLHLTGTVTAGRVSRPLAGLNVLDVSPGVTAYSPKWGRTRLYLPRDAEARYVTNGRIGSSAGRFDTVPSTGFLLVARGAGATTWLASLRQGTVVTVSTTVKSDTAKPFTQAYAVGDQIVHRGVARAGMACRRRYPQPARTAIGFASGGKRLVIAIISDVPGHPMHGLDSVQTARLMKDLGADEAYLFDGSGSTELLARMPGDTSTLSLRNPPADGVERPMPVGFGIFRRG